MTGVSKDVEHARGRLAARSQVTLKTAFTVCFAVVATAAMVLFVLETWVALTLTVAAMMLAIALDHGVSRMEARGIRRGWAIAVTTVALVMPIVGLMLEVAPAAVRQLREFIAQAPRMLDSLRNSPSFETWNQRFGLEERLKDALSGAAGLAQTAVNPILAVLSSAVGAIAGFVTVLFLSIFMLVFGVGLFQRMLALTPAVDQPRWKEVGAKSYGAVGGYLGGVLFICSVNATLTTTFLALIGTPYFTFLAVLFLAELLGIAGAVVAVPAVAVAQIFFHELLESRQGRLTGKGSPGEPRGPPLPPLFEPEPTRPSQVHWETALAPVRTRGPSPANSPYQNDPWSNSPSGRDAPERFRT